MRRKKYKYDFAGKQESERGRVSILYALVSFVLMAVSFGSVYLNISVVVTGLFGFAATILSVVGFFMALKSFKEKESAHNFSAAGTILNGLLAVIWIGLFLAGIK